MPETIALSPTLCTTSWSEEWKRLQAARNAADDPARWDARARSYGGKRRHSAYAARFIELMDLRPGETLLDMGCGTGAVALPVAEAGHRVVARDFSRAMLDELEKQAAEAGVVGIDADVMSWTEDWDARGVTADCVDVAAASRSIGTFDMHDSFERLTRVARRRACITLPTGPSPRSDERILEELGLLDELGRDYLYAFAILAQMGLHPEVSYIEGVRDDSYANEQEAYDSLAKMVRDTAKTAADTARVSRALEDLRTWLADNLVADERAGMPDEDGKPRGAFKLLRPRMVRWAFLSWGTAGRS